MGTQIGYWLARRSLHPSQWERIAQRVVLTCPYTADVTRWGWGLRLRQEQLFTPYGEYMRSISLWQIRTAKQVHLPVKTDISGLRSGSHCKAIELATIPLSVPDTCLWWEALPPADALLRVQAASFDCVPNDNKWAIMVGEGGSKSFPFNDRKESRRPKVTPLTASLLLTALLAKMHIWIFFFCCSKFFYYFWC